MKVEELILAAIKVEAEAKPDERVVMGRTVMTFREFAALLSRKRSREEEEMVGEFLRQAKALFESSEEFKRKVLELAGAK